MADSRRRGTNPYLVGGGSGKSTPQRERFKKVLPVTSRLQGWRQRFRMKKTNPDPKPEPQARPQRRKPKPMHPEIWMQRRDTAEKARMSRQALNEVLEKQQRKEHERQWEQELMDQRLHAVLHGDLQDDSTHHHMHVDSDLVNERKAMKALQNSRCLEIVLVDEHGKEQGQSRRLHSPIRCNRGYKGPGAKPDAKSYGLREARRSRRAARQPSSRDVAMTVRPPQRGLQQPTSRGGIIFPTALGLPHGQRPAPAAAPKRIATAGDMVQCGERSAAAVPGFTQLKRTQSASMFTRGWGSAPENAGSLHSMQMEKAKYKLARAEWMAKEGTALSRAGSAKDLLTRPNSVKPGQKKKKTSGSPRNLGSNSGKREVVEDTVEKQAAHIARLVEQEEQQQREGPRNMMFKNFLDGCGGSGSAQRAEMMRARAKARLKKKRLIT